MKEGCSLGSRGSAKGFLGGVYHIEEAILVALSLIHLRDGG